MKQYEEVKIYLENSIESGSENLNYAIREILFRYSRRKKNTPVYKWFTVGAALGLESAVEMRDEVEEEFNS